MSILDKMVKDGDGRFWGFLGCRYIKGSNREVQIALTAGSIIPIRWASFMVVC